MDNPKKHAYLILAHNEFSLLKLLIKSLDDARNDIYVHMDAKTKTFNPNDFDNITCFSELKFIPKIKVYWGGFSYTQAILSLMKEACSQQQYDYYHFISGLDIPLQSQDAIHSFCNSTGVGSEFINMSDISMQELNKFNLKKNKGIMQKILYLFSRDQSKYGSRYFFFQKYFAYKRTHLIGKFICRFGQIIMAFQQIAGIEKNKNLAIYKGTGWYSITHPVMSCILREERWIEKHFKYCLCSDEIYLQTLIKHFNLSERLSIHGSMRYIDWKRGSPYVFREDDYSELINSGCFFARKFSTLADREIIKKLYYRLLPAEAVDGILH